MLKVSHLSFSYGRKKALDDVSFEIKKGEFFAVAGPNGCGKTTLAKCIMGMLDYEGEIIVNGRAEKSYKRREFARTVALLEQNPQNNISLNVYEVAECGRYAHKKSTFDRGGKSEYEIISSALKEAGAFEFAGRAMSELSGGERQRAFLARVLAQDPMLMLLDEPTNHLDIAYQNSVIKVAEKFVKDGGTVAAILHDLSLVRSHADRVLIMKDGQNIYCGAPGGEEFGSKLNVAYDMDVSSYMRSLLEKW